MCMRPFSLLLVWTLLVGTSLFGCQAAQDIISGKKDRTENPNNFHDVIVPADPDNDNEVALRARVADSRSLQKQSRVAIKSIQVGDFEEAVTHLESILADEKVKDVEIHNALAICYEVLGEYEKAIVQYKLANSDDSRDEFQQAIARCENFFYSEF